MTADELAALYLDVRDEYPHASPEEVAILIRRRLTRDQILDLASEILIIDADGIENTEKLAYQRLLGIVLQLEAGDDAW